MLFLRIQPEDIADVVVAAQGRPVVHGLLFLVAGTGENFRGHKFTGANPHVVGPIRGVLRAFRRGQSPGETFRMVVGPKPEAEGDLLEPADAIDPLRLGLGAGQRGQEQPPREWR